jgi:hypothetical protein
MADVTEINCETGEVIERDYTPEELANREKVTKEWADELALREQEKTRIAEAKASAEAKLAALGLTPEEIAAL